MKSTLSNTRGMLGIAAGACAVIIGYVWHSGRPPANRAASAVSDGPVLKKQWEKLEDDGADVIVSGEVTNISADRIVYFQGVTTFFDGKGRVLRTNPVVLGSVSLNPGETTKYRTITGSLPDLRIEATSFSDVSGIPLPTERAPQSLTGPLEAIPGGRSRPG